MRHYLSNLLLFAIVTVLPLGLAFGQEANGPRLKMAELSYDFGTVKSGLKMSHLFEFSNSGDDVLVIEKVQST